MTADAVPPEPANDKLHALRREIDQVDQAIQEAVTRRARLAQQVAAAKEAAGDVADFYRPEREAQILREVIRRNSGPLPDEEMARLFREIMSACLALQRPLRIAYLGPAGTFTQAAALKHFGHSVDTLPLDAIDQVFREVESGDAHYGVVPVENSTEGVVTHTLDTFVNSPLQICGEVSLRIHHCLFSTEQDLAAVTRVYSHQQSLAQCRQWLDTHLPRAERMGVSSNAEAARRVRQEPGAGAVAGEVAGETYGLHLLAANIEDEPANTTRFLIIGRRSVPPSGDDKTSILISAHNRPGALYELLEPLAKEGISMTRIESRPSRRVVWDYFFFVDLEGHRDDPGVGSALERIADQASVLKVLGSYPRAVL